MSLRTLFSPPGLADAETELRAELAAFSHDGLVQLASDLEQGRVTRRSWGGCVLSYRRGAPGSVHADRRGRRGNAFTRFWDAECLDGDFVLAEVRQELQRRVTAAPLRRPWGTAVPAGI